MDNISIINASIESITIVMCIVLLIGNILNIKKGDKLNALFFWILLNNILLLAVDLVTWFFHGSDGEYVHTLLYICNYFLVLLAICLMALINYYINLYISFKYGKRGKVFFYLITVSLIVQVIVFVVGQFFHLFFTINEDNLYVRGPLIIAGFIFQALMFAIFVFIIINNRKVLSRRETGILLTVIAIPALGLIFQTAFFGIMLWYVAIAIAQLIIYIGIQSQISKLLLVKELEVHEARIELMLSQIKPHFIFNTLATIKNLISKTPEEAENLLDDFSTYLRNNINTLSQRKIVSFKEEMSHVQVFLNIEKVRFKDRLNIELDLQFTDFKVPVLSVQPLVENAVRHGILNKPGGGTVSIGAYQTEQTYEVIIKDDGGGFDPDTLDPTDNHVGLKNVKERIATLCGGNLKFESSAQNGTTVTLSIPKGV